MWWRSFRRRRDYVYQRLVDMGLTWRSRRAPSHVCGHPKFGMDSNTFCTRMLKEGLVGVIPGIHFGTEGFMRLSYCYSDADLKEDWTGSRSSSRACKRARRAADQTPAALLIGQSIQALSRTERKSLTSVSFRVVHIVQGHADGDDTGHQSNPYIFAGRGPQASYTGTTEAEKPPGSS